jgi:hypothetical protein
MADLERRSALRLIGISLMMPAVTGWADTLKLSHEPAATGSLDPYSPGSAYLDKLEAHFPGITKHAAYASLIPHSAVISNSASKPLRAYALTWTGVSHSSRALVYTRRYANRPSAAVLPRHITAARPAIFANSSAFVTPFFSLDMRTYSSLKASPSRLPTVDPVRQIRVRKLIKSLAPGTTLRPELTAALHGSQASGPKAQVLVKHLTLCRSAEHDAALAVSRHFASQAPSGADLATHLSDTIAAMSSRHYKGAHGIYSRAQLRYARYLWNTLKSHGPSYSWAAVLRTSNSHRPAIMIA